MDARSTNSTEAMRPKRGIARWWRGAPCAWTRGQATQALGLLFVRCATCAPFLTLRLPKGLAWCCDLLLPARHLSFGRVTRRGLSGRWHFDLLHVSNGHNVKSRPHVAGNQDPRLRDDDMAANRRDFFNDSNLRASHLCRSPPRRNRRIHLRRFDGAKGGRRPVSVRRC